MHRCLPAFRELICGSRDEEKAHHDQSSLIPTRIQKQSTSAPRLNQSVPPSRWPLPLLALGDFVVSAGSKVSASGIISTSTSFATFATSFGAVPVAGAEVGWLFAGGFWEYKKVECSTK